ncbi:MAG: GAF domain-containing protein [Spirochaetota bacterium]
MPHDNRLHEMIGEIRALSVHDDPGSALQRVCMYLKREVAHYDWVGYYLAVPEEQLLVLGPFEGAPTEHTRIAYGDGICGQAAVRGGRFVVPDVSAESNYLACSIETRAEIVLPVYHNGAFVGELDIDSHTRDPFSEFDDVLLGEVVSITAPLVASLSPGLSGG